VGVPVRQQGQLTIDDKEWVRQQILGDNIPDYLIAQGMTWIDRVENINVYETIVS
jgi:hypothetical protein